MNAGTGALTASLPLVCVCQGCDVSKCHTWMENGMRAIWGGCGAKSLMSVTQSVSQSVSNSPTHTDTHTDQSIAVGRFDPRGKHSTSQSFCVRTKVNRRIHAHTLISQRIYMQQSSVSQSVRQFGWTQKGSLPRPHTHRQTLSHTQAGSHAPCTMHT